MQLKREIYQATISPAHAQFVLVLLSVLPIGYFLVFYFSTQPKLVTDLTTPELAMTSVLNIFCPFVPNLTFQGNAARRNLIKFNIINYTVSFLVNAMLVTFPLVWYGQHFFNTTIPVLDELCLFLHPFVRFSQHFPPFLTRPCSQKSHPFSYNCFGSLSSCSSSTLAV